jgi:hypothetical protein
VLYVRSKEIQTMLRTLAFAALASLSFVACAVDQPDDDDATTPIPAPNPDRDGDDQEIPDDAECASLDDTERHDCPE